MSGRKRAQGKREQPPPSFKRASARLRHDLSEADRSFVEATNGTGRRLATMGALMAILKFLDSPEVMFPSRAVTHLFEALADVALGRIDAIFRPVPMPVGRRPDAAETQVIKAAIVAAVDLLSDGGKAAGNLSRVEAAREISKWLGKKHYTAKQILDIAREFSPARRHRAVPETRSRRVSSANPNTLHILNRELHRLRPFRFYDDFRKRHRDWVEQNPGQNSLPVRKARAQLMIQVALAAFASPKSGSPEAQRD